MNKTLGGKRGGDYLCGMKKFFYSTDFTQMNLPELKGCCLHLLCTAGEGSFIVNGHCYHVSPNDLVVLSFADRVRQPAAGPDMRVEMFAADTAFLNRQLPANNYGIGGSISLYDNPIIPLSDTGVRRLTDDLHRLRDRMADTDMLFYDGLMGSLCLTMMYDIFEFHTLRDQTTGQTERASYIVKSPMDLLSSGLCQTEREVGYYAARLHVSAKYLSATVRRLTGQSVNSLIDRYAVAILKDLLDDPRLSLTQVSDRMAFSSLSYFSRYCTKHLGQSPSQYRSSMPGRDKAKEGA